MGATHGEMGKVHGGPRVMGSALFLTLVAGGHWSIHSIAVLYNLRRV